MALINKVIIECSTNVSRYFFLIIKFYFAHPTYENVNIRIDVLGNIILCIYGLKKRSNRS